MRRASDRDIGSSPSLVVSSGSTAADAAVTTICRALTVRFAAGLALPRHYHDDANLVVTLRGTFERTVRQQRLISEPGQLFTEPAGEPHANCFDRAGATVLIIQPLGKSRTPYEEALFDAPVVRRDSRIGRLAGEIAHEIRHPDTFSILAVDGLAMQLFALVLRTSARERDVGRPAYLGRIVEIIHEEGHERLALPTLAAQADVHPAHLARVFRSAYGISIARYARNLRLERATHALLSTDVPISAIALDAGFADQSHFTRAFRAFHGTTPARLRLLRREGRR